MMKKPQQGIVIALLCILGTMLVMKLQLVLNRQFDPDEMSYLHWGYLLSQGRLVYKDFFFYVTPLYPAMLAPLFFLPHSAMLAVGARVFMFTIYGITLWTIYLLSKKITGDTVMSILTVIIFTAFPLMFDKTIEIRPDMVMTLLFLSGVIQLMNSLKHTIRKHNAPAGGTHEGFHQAPATPRYCLPHMVKAVLRYVCGQKTNKNTVEKKRGEDVGWDTYATGPACTYNNAFFAGFLLSLSFLVMFKIIFVVPAILFLSFSKNIHTWIKTLVWMTIGAIIPVIVLLLYLQFHTLIPLFVNALTHDANIVNIGNSSFPVWMTLSPWPLVYVTSGGISMPYVVSTALWFLAVPGLFVIWKKNHRMGIFLLLLTLGALGLIILFPKPYVQYFIIPSFIASVAVACLIGSVPKKIQYAFILLASCVLLLSFYIQTKDRQVPLGTNQEQLGVLSDVLTLIKPDEPVYDMVGSFVFRPDGYYICCHPYIQFVHLLRSPIPTLSESLIQTKTKFLVMDQKAYVFWIAKPEDIAFMTAHYLPSVYKKIFTLGSGYQCNNGICIQINAEGNPVSQTPTFSLDIIIEEQYNVTVQPNDQWITINGKTYKNGDVLSLSPGLYAFTVSARVNSFSVQLNR